MTQPPCEQTTAWHHLENIFDARGRSFDLRQAFHDHPERTQMLSIAAPLVFGDLSKHLWDGDIRDALLALAAERGVTARRDAMLHGEVINTTEHRTVRHAALRTPAGSPFDDEAAGKARAEAARFLTSPKRFAPKARSPTLSTLASVAPTWDPRWQWLR